VELLQTLQMRPVSPSVFMDGNKRAKAPSRLEDGQKGFRVKLTEGLGLIHTLKVSSSGGFENQIWRN